MKLRYILAAVGVGATALTTIAGLLWGEVGFLVTAAALSFGGMGYTVGLAIERGDM